MHTFIMTVFYFYVNYHFGGSSITGIVTKLFRLLYDIIVDTQVECAIADNKGRMYKRSTKTF